MPERQIELFFDIGSSYSYLAATQMEALASRTGVPVRWRPFLLGAVFKATGNEMPARVPAKAQWMMQDMARWSQHYGIPLRMPSRFPLVTLRTQRALAAAELRDPAAVAPFALALFRAYWAEDRDPTCDDVIRELARSVDRRRDRRAGDEGPPARDHRRSDPTRRVRRARDVRQEMRCSGETTASRCWSSS